MALEDFALTDSPVVKEIEITVKMRWHEDGSKTSAGELTPRVLVDGQLVTQEFPMPPEAVTEGKQIVHDLFVTYKG